MNEQIIIIILGLIGGFFLGLTGFTPTALILFVLEYLKIGDYKTNLGTMLFFNLFPISIGSVYDFYIHKKINIPMGITLTITIILASYLSSKLAVGEGSFSNKTLKYITAFISLLISIIYFYIAYHEKN
jgi:uncharacterized membrane protein YfcA